jgi:DnaJ-domain-containing protein 1
MLGELAEQSLLFAPEDPALVALLVVPPGLLACYVCYRLVTRQLRPSASLGPLESIELERSLLLYEMASKRIAADHDRKRNAPRRWRPGRRDGLGASDEAEDLRIYMHDLRATIARLRSRPFKRFKHWMHAVSVQSALGRALTCYMLVMGLGVAWFCYAQPILWARGIDPGFKAYVMWQAVKGQLLLANWLAANAAAIALPMLYAARRMGLSRAHRTQIGVLRDFAGAGAEPTMQERQGQAGGAGPQSPPPGADESNWSTVLGVSPAATLDEVKQAYKGLIKKNHPDRVNDMSPSFIRLAEAETKKLNVAYAEALTSLQQ